MKKLLFLMVIVLIAAGCSNDENLATPDQDLLKSAKAPKVDVCHYDMELGTWHVININSNALEAHLAHGDVLLVDSDEDGWVELENECVPGGDCDDTNPDINPGVEEVCDNGIDDNCNGEIDENCADPCLDEAITQGEAWLDNILDGKGNRISTTITGPTTFTVYFQTFGDGRGDPACYINYMEATGTPGNCGFTFSTHELVDCP
jgi:hypothetical protein